MKQVVKRKLRGRIRKGEEGRVTFKAPYIQIYEVLRAKVPDGYFAALGVLKKKKKKIKKNQTGNE